MRILVAYPMAAGAVTLLGRETVSYRPEIAGATGKSLRSAIEGCRPDIVLAEQVPDRPDLEAWRELMPHARLFVVLRSNAVDERDRSDELLPDVFLHHVHGDGPNVDLDVLTAAERLYTRDVTCAQVRATVDARRDRPPHPAESAVVVGAGVVGALTALRLAQAGYRVRLIDACADPRAGGDWRTFGCTRGGGNARMFTLSEADNYNDQDGSGTASFLFRGAVSERGWRICGEESLGAAERSWIDAHELLPPWQARAYNRDIFGFNDESRILWDELRHCMPRLFDQVELRDDILRLYTDPVHLEWAAARQERIGALRARLDPSAIRIRYPALADACGDQDGLVVGGLEVLGFTVNVHDFVSNVLDFLEAAGTVMSWGTTVRGLAEDAGTVDGLVTDSGLVRADHYVLAPGVYGRDMLAGTASATHIQGVLGVWTTIPNLEPKLHNSLKIARKGHMAEDANVTVAKNGNGEDVLEYGSGYGYTGLRADNILGEELQALYDAVEENVRDFFPRAHAAAVESGLLLSSRRLCVRPWTPTGLGIFEVRPATSGLLIVAGGHNTGGFAQSPSVAHAVVAALQGRAHPMHELYHPDRAGHRPAGRAGATVQASPRVLADAVAGVPPGAAAPA